MSRFADWRPFQRFGKEFVQIEGRNARAQLAESGPERRKVLGHDVLKDCPRGVPVLVDENIAKPDDIRPRHGAVAGLEVAGQVGGRFSDDAELVRDPGSVEVVVHDTPGCPSLDLLNRVKDVVSAEVVSPPHSGRASCSASWSTRGLMFLTSPTSTGTPSSRSSSSFTQGTPQE